MLLIKILLFTMLISLSSCKKDDIIEISSTGYYIQKYSENDKFYLLDSPINSTGVGIVDGTLKLVGYNKHYIVCVVESIFIENGQRNPDEVYLIEVQTKKIIKIPLGSLQLDIRIQGITLEKPNKLFN